MWDTGLIMLPYALFFGITRNWWKECRGLQIGRSRVDESFRSTLQHRVFTSSAQVQQQRKRSRGRIHSSKQVLAEKDRPGKPTKPRRKLRLRGRFRLLLRYVRRGLLPPRGFSWKPVLLAALVTCTCTLAAVILRVTAGPAPQNIQYSDLIDHIHARTVTSALFEEGSQRLLFNVQPVVNEPEPSPVVVELPGATTEESRSSEQVGGTDASSSGNSVSEKARVSKVQRKGEWQYVTRRVRNDEAYLLGLMREKGVRYSSAPQSVSASLRSLLFTVISLWIPLSPLLWLLHRQISGNNSSTQRRRSKSRLVNFTDVAGIDTAKAELAEVHERHSNFYDFDTIFWITFLFKEFHRLLFLASCYIIYMVTFWGSWDLLACGYIWFPRCMQNWSHVFLMVRCFFIDFLIFLCLLNFACRSWHV